MKGKFLGLVAAVCMLLIPISTSADEKAEPLFNLKVSACAVTKLDITFFPKPGADVPPLKIEAPLGCRCSFIVEGKDVVPMELIPTGIMPMSFCGIGDPEDAIKKDK